MQSGSLKKIDLRILSTFSFQTSGNNYRYSLMLVLVASEVRTNSGQSGLV